MKIIVGSTAARYHGARFDRKTDIDIWSDGTKDDITVPDAAKLDWSFMPTEVLQRFSVDSLESGHATLDDLMTIKMSHLPFDIFWRKHLNDYLVLKIKYNCKKNEELFKSLRDYWKNFHTKSNLSLYKTKDEFFDDYVTKKIDHDELHRLIAHPLRPVYESCLKDGHEVAIDKNKFDELSFSSKIRMFREEVTVIACERWLLNEKCDITFNQAYRRALHKTVTALTKGWASEFMVEHIEHFLSPCKDDIKHVPIKDKI